jgi:3-hydroxyisobutyrate dehydrogenase
LDRAAVLGIFEGSPIVSARAAEKLQRIGRDDYSAQYPLALALQDVSLALLEVDIERFAVTNSLAGEWQRAVDASSATRT